MFVNNNLNVFNCHIKLLKLSEIMHRSNTVHRKLFSLKDTEEESTSWIWQNPKNKLLSGTVSVRRDHVSSALCDSPAVLAGSMEPILSLYRVPIGGIKATERKHLLHVFKHVIKQSASKRKVLEMMPLPTGGILMGLEMLLKMLLGVSILALTKEAKVFK